MMSQYRATTRFSWCASLRLGFLLSLGHRPLQVLLRCRDGVAVLRGHRPSEQSTNRAKPPTNTADRVVDFYYC